MSVKKWRSCSFSLQQETLSNLFDSYWFLEGFWLVLGPIWTNSYEDRGTPVCRNMRRNSEIFEYMWIYVDTLGQGGSRWCACLIVEFVRMWIYKMVVIDPIRVQGNWRSSSSAKQEAARGSIKWWGVTRIKNCKAVHFCEIQRRSDEKGVVRIR